MSEEGPNGEEEMFIMFIELSYVRCNKGERGIRYQRCPNPEQLDPYTRRSSVIAPERVILEQLYDLGMNNVLVFAPE